MTYLLEQSQGSGSRPLGTEIRPRDLISGTVGLISGIVGLISDIWGLKSDHYLSQIIHYFDLRVNFGHIHITKIKAYVRSDFRPHGSNFRLRLSDFM